MRIQCSQTNSTVADLKSNLAMIKAEIMYGFYSNADVVLLPELVTTGYPPRDYLYQQWIWDEHKSIVAEVVNVLRGLKRQLTVIFGGLHEVELSFGRKERYNAAYIIDNRFGVRFVHKRLLPQYDVFDESRYFKSAIDEPYLPVPIAIQGASGEYVVPCDVLICEDIWNNEFQQSDRWMPAAYAHDPIAHLKGEGPLFILNGSPFWTGKVATTKKLVERICSRIRRPVCWVNQVGAHDDIITGGYSMVSIPTDAGTVTRVAKAFEIDRMIFVTRTLISKADDLNADGKIGALEAKHGIFDGMRAEINGKTVAEEDFDTWCNYQACVLFVRDYMRRCGFKKAVLGLSGGIDSALVAVIAADAIGAANVIGVSLPSKFSSEHSKDDAQLLAHVIGLDYRVVPIGAVHEAVRAQFLSGGKQEFDNPTTDENIQPRARALTLMVISNDEKALLLTTGNKSEITVGYCTIYGDMCGGIAPISDLWKTDVFALCKFINKYRNGIIPSSTLTKPPSAELRPDQKDADSLPPYEELDPVLKMIVEEDLTPGEIKAKTGSIPQWFPGIYRKYKISEFKRLQMPPGCKVKSRSFGTGRRMPVASKESHL